MICSLLFTFVFGTWAAKSRRAERIIIPLIDILQSVPVLGYLSITLVAFVVLFRGSLLGPECAAIFTIFTAQVWNMTLSFYQSVANVPEELNEAAKMFHLNAWQKFWRIEVPFAMPGLIWNMMMSMSGSWVFLVASEAMSVANQNITLPGIGSYIDLAIRQQNVPAMWWVTLAVFLVIVIYDLAHFIIPDRLTLYLTIAAVLLLGYEYWLVPAQFGDGNWVPGEEKNKNGSFVATR